MNYDFPIINHIDDVLPAIQDSPEFIVAEKDGYKVVNYVVATHDTFPAVGEKFCPGCRRKDSEILVDGCGSQRCPDIIDVAALRRECRGLVFDSEGKLINRRYHKFFNCQEKEETQLDRIDWSKPHHILEKLDGSMISPCLINGHLRWISKMGLTDTSMEAEVFVAKNKKYTEFALDMLDQGYTPIFEWVSNKNRIVLDYPEDNLILTALRYINSGKYFSYETMFDMAIAEYDIPVVKAFQHFRSPEAMLDAIRQSEGTEGIVVRFEDGQMVKIKSEWYIRIHKVKSLLGQERDVVSLILNNELDDMIPVLPKEDAEKIEKFQTALMERIALCSKNLDAQTKLARASSSRKIFALEIAKDYNPVWRSLIFQFWDKECNEHLTYQAVVDIIKKNCGSNSSYAKVKEAFLKDVNL